MSLMTHSSAFLLLEWTKVNLSLFIRVLHLCFSKQIWEETRLKQCSNTYSICLAETIYNNGIFASDFQSSVLNSWSNHCAGLDWSWANCCLRNFLAFWWWNKITSWPLWRLMCNTELSLLAAVVVVAVAAVVVAALDQVGRCLDVRVGVWEIDWVW